MAADCPGPATGFGVETAGPFEDFPASIAFLIVSVMATCSARASEGEVKLNT